MNFARKAGFRIDRYDKYSLSSSIYLVPSHYNKSFEILENSIHCIPCVGSESWTVARPIELQNMAAQLELKSNKTATDFKVEL